MFQDYSQLVVAIELGTPRYLDLMRLRAAD